MNRLEKEYNVIRKEEQEEQIEVRVCIFQLIPSTYRSKCFLSRDYEMKIVY